MSSIAVNLHHTPRRRPAVAVDPGIKPGRRSRDQRRGPQAHPDRWHSAPVMVARAAITADRLTPIAPAPSWRLTARGYAVLVAGAAVAASFLAVMIVITFFGISNAPLG